MIHNSILFFSLIGMLNRILEILNLLMAYVCVRVCESTPSCAPTCSRQYTRVNDITCLPFLFFIY